LLSARSIVLALEPADKLPQSTLLSALTTAFGGTFFLIRTLPIPLLARSDAARAAACGSSRVSNALGWMSVLPLVFNLFWSHLLIQKARKQQFAGGASSGRGIPRASR
jgi:hypothetical protein